MNVTKNKLMYHNQINAMLSSTVHIDDCNIKKCNDDMRYSYVILFTHPGVVYSSIIIYLIC